MSRHPKLVRAPMAMTSDGTLLINLAADPRLVAREALELALAEGGPVFMGVAVTKRERTAAMKRIDDAAAETSATILGERQRRRRPHARKIRRTPS